MLVSNLVALEDNYAFILALLNGELTVLFSRESKGSPDMHVSAVG